MIANGQPSLTAFTAAAARAAHLIVDDDPPIFADTLAEAMLGERAGELIGFHRAHGTHPILSGARAQVTCRSRYTEDGLADGIGRGTAQYVMLGAGLDSFARRSRLAGQVRVFEIDHPATQEWKRRIAPVPENVSFVPVDFGWDSLRERLGAAGFDFAAPAFVSWLGTTMYLEENAIEQTLSVTGGFAPGWPASCVQARVLRPGSGPARAGHGRAAGRLENHLRESREVAEIAARHLAPPARPDPEHRSRR